MRGTLLTLSMLLPCASAPIQAQGRWSLTLERGYTTFSEAAHDTSTPRVHVIPWHPSLYTLRLARSGRRSGVAVALTYGTGELAGAVQDLVVLPGSDYTFLEAAPEISYRVGVTSMGATLLAHAGPLVDFWFPSGADPRSTFGGLIGATVALPLAARWQVSVRADLAVTTSELTKDEASAEIIRAGTMRRRRLGVGITRQL